MCVGVCVYSDVVPKTSTSTWFGVGKCHWLTAVNNEPHKEKGSRPGWQYCRTDPAYYHSLGAFDCRLFLSPRHPFTRPCSGGKQHQDVVRLQSLAQHAVTRAQALSSGKRGEEGARRVNWCNSKPMSVKYFPLCIIIVIAVRGVGGKLYYSWVLLHVINQVKRTNAMLFNLVNIVQLWHFAPMIPHFHLLSYFQWLVIVGF